MENFFKKYNVAFLIIIIAIAAFFRLYDLKNVPPGLYPDEAMNGNNALESISTGDYKVFYPENNGREGMFINIQAQLVKKFGNEPWVLRLASALFGIFTVLGLYFLTKELFGQEIIAMIAAFLLATSYWHINFSRIGFRAIMAPFFLTWGLWLFWRIITRNYEILFLKSMSQPDGARQDAAPAGADSRALKKYVFRNFAYSIIAGAIFGLGIHSYIAYRIAPFILIPGLFVLLRNGWKTKNFAKSVLIIVLFGIGALAVSFPLLNYFYQNPQDFLGRTSQISIFSAQSPAKELSLNIAKTIGMFFVRGDGNWRHNFPNQPELWWPVAIVFLIGLIVSFSKIFKKNSLNKAEYLTLIFWFIFGLFPSLFSAEGIPHALRAIIVVPVTMIFAAIGLNFLIEKTKTWFDKQQIKFPDAGHKIIRIKKELAAFSFIILGATAVNSFNQYFQKWAINPNTNGAFNKDYKTLGHYLKYSQPDIKKFVVVNAGGTDVRGLPMPTQPVMFLTDTFLPEKQIEKNIYYILPDKLDDMLTAIKAESRAQIFMLETDKDLRQKISDAIPEIFTYTNSEVLIQEK